jgi:hypothetical protein
LGGLGGEEIPDEGRIDKHRVFGQPTVLAQIIFVALKKSVSS